MRVGILLSMLGRKAGGLESYESGLLHGLAALDRSNEYELFCLSQQTIESAKLEQSNFQFRRMWPSKRWVSLPAVLPLQLIARQVDVLHATFVQPPFCPIPSVFTVHDLGMFTNPEFYHATLRWRMNRLILAGIRKASVVICISRAIRELVQELFEIPEERIATVYHGVGAGFKPQSAQRIEEVREKYGLQKPYVLFVGQLRPGIKNLNRLVEAYYRFRRETKSEVRLVLAGRRPHARRYPSEDLDETIRRCGGREYVQELGYVADEDLSGLYAGAEMLALPSLCEGFGFPVLEAMACGTPVLASNIPTLTEVSGGAALLVDPFSVEDMAEGMHRLLSDNSLQENLRSRGYLRAAEFTWERTAEQTLAAYKTAANLAPRQERVRSLAKG